MTLFRNPNRNTPEYDCEIKWKVPDFDLFVKEHALSFEQSFVSALVILATHFRKAHDKQIDRKKQSDFNYLRYVHLPDS